MQTEHNDDQCNLPVSHKMGAASNTKINKYRVAGNETAQHNKEETKALLLYDYCDLKSN